MRRNLLLALADYGPSYQFIELLSGDKFTLAVFNLIVQWHSLPVDTDGSIRLSIAEFSS